MEAYRAGNVALINAIGNGAADDKGYLLFRAENDRLLSSEKPILQNAPTHLPYFKQDYDYVLSHLDSLVIKEVSEAGGYGVVFGRDLSPEKLDEMRRLIADNPRRWIAQEVIDFKDLDIFGEWQIGGP